ncbi:MAG TPA: ribonuclease III domain-containing protein [Lachnospiraceae bacterium]|nr:ribonuclease III domain-containing protein [Lachnospiraceae bacterium]HPF30399.1 ribonuclease III domain-containing protein [Lachnospiraceae bacterium]
MTEQTSILCQIREQFATGEQELGTYSPLVLAYLGDCVYELIIRTMIVEKRNCAVQKLHREATWYVKAATQAALITAVMDELTEEEEAVYRRGRNAKSHTTPKNADLADYRKATGLEAVVGYLYLKDDEARILSLVHQGLQAIEKGENNGIH